MGDEPFETAERKLGRFGLHLSDHTLQRIVGTVGGEREAQRRAEAEALLALRAEPPAVAAPQRLPDEVPEPREGRLPGRLRPG